MVLVRLQETEPADQVRPIEIRQICRRRQVQSSSVQVQSTPNFLHGYTQIAYDRISAVLCPLTMVRNGSALHQTARRPDSFVKRATDPHPGTRLAVIKRLTNSLQTPTRELPIRQRTNIFASENSRPPATPSTLAPLSKKNLHDFPVFTAGRSEPNNALERSIWA